MPKRSSQSGAEFAHECDQVHDVVPQHDGRTTDLFHRRGRRRSRFRVLAFRPFVQVEQRLIGGIKRSDFVGSMSTALTAAKFRSRAAPAPSQ